MQTKRMNEFSYVQWYVVGRAKYCNYLEMVGLVLANLIVDEPLWAVMVSRKQAPVNAVMSQLASLCNVHNVAWSDVR